MLALFPVYHEYSWRKARWVRAGVRRVGYGLEVGRSVRAGRGHIVSPRAQLVLKKFVEAELYK